MIIPVMTQLPYSFKKIFELGLRSFLPVMTFERMLEINLFKMVKNLLLVGKSLPFFSLNHKIINKY